MCHSFKPRLTTIVNKVDTIVFMFSPSDLKDSAIYKLKWNACTVQIWACASAATPACPRPPVPAARTAASIHVRRWRCRMLAGGCGAHVTLLLQTLRRLHVETFTVSKCFPSERWCVRWRLQQEQQRAGEGGRGGQEQADAGFSRSAGTTRIGVAEGSS